jgi:hypothetical protein
VELANKKNGSKKEGNKESSKESKKDNEETSIISKQKNFH